jgi:hypothetical protein
MNLEGMTERLGMLRGRIRRKLGWMPSPTSFRRLFIEHGHVCCETGMGNTWYLPGKYDARVMLERVKRAEVVDLKHWRPLQLVWDGR